MDQVKRAPAAPATYYGRPARYALHTIVSFEVGPQLERFERLADLARCAAGAGRWADKAVCLQWFRGQWVPL